MDYSKIVLTRDEQRLFNRFKHADEAVLTRAEFNLLYKKNLVKGAIGGKSNWFEDIPASGTCQISDNGKDLRAFQSGMQHRNRIENIRYCITTGISVIALITAIVSIVLQYQ